MRKFHTLLSSKSLQYSSGAIIIGLLGEVVDEK
jgi:hypothetical protein